MEQSAIYATGRSGVEIRHENDPRMGGMAYVIYRSGVCEGAAMTEAGARSQAALTTEFGYFDPTEPRQRARMRELEAIA